MYRLGAAIDAFLLKVCIEEVLGYPAQLIPDGQVVTGFAALDGVASIYHALETGDVDLYPEVRCAAGPPGGVGLPCRRVLLRTRAVFHSIGCCRRPREVGRREHLSHPQCRPPAE